MSTSHPYASLTPERVLDASEHCGLQPDGRLLALNSYENRVYQIGLEDAAPVIAKFYRPGRWSDAAILEEHGFVAELAGREVPVVGALQLQGKILHRHGGFRFALYPRMGGRPAEFDRDETLQWMGRFLGRLHAVGAVARFRHRPRLDIASFGTASREFLLRGNWLPADLLEAWSSVSAEALQGVGACFELAGQPRQIRLHGDCHAGNVLWSDDGPLFLDFDDCRSGPAIQDLWMLLSGDRESMQAQLAGILEGYQQFSAFDYRELHLLEALRTLRLLHYCAWIAQRWDDPAFPAAFPWFNTQRYWQDRILELREQIAAMAEPPLSV